MTENNLAAAINTVAGSIKQTIHEESGATPEDPISQILVRAPKSSHERWKKAADFLGISLAKYVRDLCDTRAAELLDCTHPQQTIRINQWGHFCSKCGIQITRRKGK